MLIEGGHLYIAQPPLYKVARGRSEVYLKDDAALDQYLVDAGLDGLLLEGAEQRTGEALRELVEHARRVRTLMHYAPKNYDPAMIEALALAGALDPEIGKSGKTAAIATVAKWLGAGDLEATWTGEVAEEGGYLIQRRWRGVTDAHIIEPGFLASAEARKLHALAAEQREAYLQPSVLKTLRKGNAPAAEAAPAAEGEDNEDLIEAEAETRGKTIPITRPSEC